jgi:hypothetical protein
MFQNFARNATAAANPVKINGVARFNVSNSANCDPNAPLMIRPNTENGFAPAAIANSDAITTVDAIAKIGGITLRAIDGLGIGSRRMRHLALIGTLSGHP